MVFLGFLRMEDNSLVVFSSLILQVVVSCFLRLQYRFWGLESKSLRPNVISLSRLYSPHTCYAVMPWFDRLPLLMLQPDAYSSAPTKDCIVKFGRRTLSLLLLFSFLSTIVCHIRSVSDVVLILRFLNGSKVLQRSTMHFWVSHSTPMTSSALQDVVTYPTSRTPRLPLRCPYLCYKFVLWLDTAAGSVY